MILNEEKVSECDQLWVTDDTRQGESIRCGHLCVFFDDTLLDEERVSECDHLWVTDDTQRRESIGV